VKKTKALLISYLAGYFDGKGCIFAKFEPDKKYCNLSLEVDSRYDKKPLNLMFSMFGGKVDIRWSERDQKCFYHWQLEDVKKIRKALKLMLPFLRTKLFQAQLGIRLAERIIIGTKKRLWSKNHPLSEHEKTKREEIVKQLKELKTQISYELKLAETKRKDSTTSAEAIVQK